MTTVIIEQLSNEGWLSTNAADATNASFPAIAPQEGAPAYNTPAGMGVIPIGHQGSIGPGRVLLVPYGTGSATNTFNMNVYGWRGTTFSSTTSQTKLWIPVLLSSYAVTLGSATGVANSDLGTTYLFNTSIVPTGGGVGVSSGMAATSLDWYVISPGSNAIGMIVQATLGFRFLSVTYNLNSSATAANALYCKL